MCCLTQPADRLAKITTLNMAPLDTPTKSHQKPEKNQNKSKKSKPTKKGTEVTKAKAAAAFALQKKLIAAVLEVFLPGPIARYTYACHEVFGPCDKVSRPRDVV